MRKTILDEKRHLETKDDFWRKMTILEVEKWK
jgi:hypothetical protein